MADKKHRDGGGTGEHFRSIPHRDGAVTDRGPATRSTNFSFSPEQQLSKKFQNQANFCLRHENMTIKLQISSASTSHSHRRFSLDDGSCEADILWVAVEVNPSRQAFAGSLFSMFFVHHHVFFHYQLVAENRGLPDFYRQSDDGSESADNGDPGGRCGKRTNQPCSIQRRGSDASI